MALSLTGCATTSTVRPRKVIVVGVEFAGIDAAKALTALGHHVTVLEARTRVGGRADTRMELGVPIDMGASWLNGGRRNKLKRLARNHNIETYSTDYPNGLILLEDGRRLPAAEYLYGDYPQSIYSAAVAVKDNNLSIADLLSQLPNPADPLCKQLAKLKFESEYAIELDSLGVATLRIESETYGSGASSAAEQFVSGGMGNLASAMSAGLDICLSEPVREIVRQAGSVIIETSAEQLRADAVVVTVPLGVLKSGDIKFSPPLPEIHKNAMARMEMGVLNKVALSFPQVNWPDKDYFVTPAGPCQSWWNLNLYDKSTVLVGLAGGRSAGALASMDLDGRIQTAYKPHIKGSRD